MRESLNSQLPRKEDFNLKFFDQQIDSSKFKALVEDNLQQGRYSQGLTGAFKFLDLVDRYQHTHDIHAEQNIKTLFQNKLIDTQEPSHLANRIAIINPTKRFLIRKVGNLTSTEVERHCRFTPEGIVQIKGKETPLQIKQATRIESRDDKKQSDISWAKDPKLNFRVIMKDSKNLLRAVFTETLPEAQQVMDYCTIFLPLPIKIVKLTSTFSKVYKRRVVEELANRMKIFNFSNVSRDSKRDSKRDFSRQSNTREKEREQQISLQNERAKVRKSTVVREFMYNSDKRMGAGLLSDWEYLSRSDNRDFGNTNLLIPSATLVPPMIPPTPRSFRSITVADTSVEFIQNFILLFERIELLKDTSIMKKPLVTLSITKGEADLYEKTFETILEKRDPNLIYLLYSEDQLDREITLDEQVSKLEVHVQVKDRLSTHTLETSVKLRVREKTNQLLYLASEDGLVRIQVRYLIGEENLQADPHKKTEGVNEDGLVLTCKEIEAADIETIKRQCWNDLTKNEYYSEDISLDVTEVLGRIEVTPKFWWFGITEEEYQILSLLEAASSSLSFVVIEAHLHMVRALIRIYQDSGKMLEKAFKSILSMIIYYLKPYYSRPLFDKVHDLHIRIGVDVNCELSSKLSVELSIFNVILARETPELADKYRHKNVHLGLICYEYHYEMYSRNFNLRVLTALWNYMFTEPERVQEVLLLVGVMLVKINAERLMKVSRFSSVVRVLTDQNKEYTDSNHILREIQSLQRKYFRKPETLVETIASKLLEDNPFEATVNSFYKKQNVRLENNSNRKVVEKREVLNRLIEQKYDMVVPKYESKVHNLHIYFHRLPSLEGGLLSIRAGDVEHECIHADHSPYYILRKVNGPVQLVFNHRGKKWINTAELIQGIHYAKLDLQEEKNEDNILEIEYTGGFLTDSQETAILRGKPSEHYLGSYMKLQNIINECNRDLGECFFLRNSQSAKVPYEVMQSVKVLFAGGSNRFNDVDFYLSWIMYLRISPLERLLRLKEYAQSMWTELFHCPSPQLYKILLREFLDKMGFPIEDTEFEFLYNTTVEEFHCPRIVSLKFTNHDGKKFRLDKYIHKFSCEKSAKGLLSDLIVSHKHVFGLILNVLKEIMPTIDGVLVLKYSSYGQVNKRLIPLKFSKESKELVVNHHHEKFTPGVYEIKDVVPELLAADSFPSFSRITNRLYQEESEASVLKSKYFKQQDEGVHKQRDSEVLNVIKCVEDKLKCVIPMRYRSSVLVTSIPFLSYFSELLFKTAYQPLPKLYLNRVEVLSRKICTFKGDLQLSDNQRGENLPINKRLGLHGNISKYNLQSPVVYFWPLRKDEFSKTRYPVFVNYGSGVFRTEQCVVLGYCRGSKNRNRVFMIVELHGKSELIPREDLLIDSIDIFTEIDINSQKYERFKPLVKEWEGKTQEEKTQELAETKKFTNVVRKEGEFYSSKGLSSYSQLYDRL